MGEGRRIIAGVLRERPLLPLLLLCAATALALGGYIADEIVEGRSFRLDAALLIALRRRGDPATPIGPAWLTQSAIDFSALGGFTLMWVFGAAGLALLWMLRRRAEALWIAAALVGSSLLDTLLKLSVHRARPEVVPHLAEVSNASFPSGHAMISSAVYLTLAVMAAEASPRRGVRVYVVAFACLLVLLIGLSRLYLGVHWPSDVAAGWCFGSVWALVVLGLKRWADARKA